MHSLRFPPQKKIILDLNHGHDFVYSCPRSRETEQKSGIAISGFLTQIQKFVYQPLLSSYCQAHISIWDDWKKEQDGSKMKAGVDEDGGQGR
jgi:hypothetical protein